MKVLFVSSGNSHYGIVPFIKSQGESLKKEGVKLDYFTVQGKGVKGYINNIKLIRNHLKDNGYDIIHAHYGLTGFFCILSFLQVPIVLSVMGSDAYGDFDIAGKRVKSSYLNMFLTQIVLIFSKGIIVKSKNILKYVPYKKKSHIIPNGVNFEQFKPNGKALNNKSILFLANSVDLRKNFKLLKDAINIINDKSIILINPYPIAHDKFSEYLNNTAVFVLTSYNEGSPNVIKEAMACNIPIVSTDVGDVREIIGKTKGCYITTFESKDVAEKINKALDFGKRTTGREDVKHLESSIVARKIIDIYESVLDKK